jgi:hypothetical protein
MKKSKPTFFAIGSIILFTALLTFSGCDMFFEDTGTCESDNLPHPFTLMVINQVKVVDRNSKAISNLSIKFSTKKIPCDGSSKPLINSTAKTNINGVAYSGTANFNINNSKDKIEVRIEVYDVHNNMVDSKSSTYSYNQFKDLPEFDTSTNIKLPKEYWQYNDDI